MLNNGKKIGVNSKVSNYIKHLNRFVWENGYIPTDYELKRYMKKLEEKKKKQF